MKKIIFFLILAPLASCFRPEQASHSVLICATVDVSNSRLVVETIADTLLSDQDELVIGQKRIPLPILNKENIQISHSIMGFAKREGKEYVAFSDHSLKSNGYMVNFYGDKSKNNAKTLASRWDEISPETLTLIFDGNGVDTNKCETRD